MLLNRRDDKTLTPSEIADGAGVSRGTITTLLDGLERSELVKRTHDSKDRRKVTITMTDEGIKRLNTMLPEHYARTRRLGNALTTDQKANLLTVINKLAQGTKDFNKPLR